MRLKKIFYSPGIISLICFLFLLPYSYKRIAPKTLRVLPINVPVEDSKEFETIFSVSEIKRHLIHKKQLRITLDDNKEINKRKFELIRHEARKLKYTFDTSSVILIIFSNNLPYSEFITLLDNCKQDSIKRYALWANHFVIYGEFPFVEIKGNSMFVFGNDIVFTKSSEKTLWKKIIASFKLYINFQSISILFGWIALVFTYLIFKKKELVKLPSSTP